MLPFCERTVSVSRSKYLPSMNRGISIPKEPKTIGEFLRKRRLELGIFQSEAALKLGVSTVTLSRWECGKVYPTWPQQPSVTAYLGHNPFTDPALGKPKGNESQRVAFLGSGESQNLGQQIVSHCLKMRKTIRKFAEEAGISSKTIWNWKTGRRQPSRAAHKRIAELLAAQ